MSSAPFSVLFDCLNFPLGRNLSKIEKVSFFWFEGSGDIRVLGSNYWTLIHKSCKP